MREKASCYTLSALGFGWLTFSTMTELTFNPNQSTNPDDLTF